MPNEDGAPSGLIQRLLDRLDDKSYMRSLSLRERNAVSTLAPDLAKRLLELQRRFDPVHWEEVIDPTHPGTIAELLAERLRKRRARRLADQPRFWGSGVYAIYYDGRHPAYRDCVRTRAPLYVGKADAASRNAVTARDHGDGLSRRLQDHAKSVTAVGPSRSGSSMPKALAPLRLKDFYYRYLVLAPAYAAAVEEILLAAHEPVWNSVCRGFGKHGDSHKTRGNTRSDWDTLHPGREWATRRGNRRNPLSPTDIVELIVEHAKRYR